MRIKALLKPIFLGFITLIFNSCEPKEEIEVTARDYHLLVDKVTAIMVNDIFSPPQASRVYVYPNIAAYEALNAHLGNYKSLIPQLNGFCTNTIIPEPAANTNLKVAALLAYMQVAEKMVFSEEVIRKYRDSLTRSWYRHNPKSLEKSKKYANEISKNVIAWMENDLYRETRSMPDYDYFEVDAARWQPTPPAYMKGIEPHWGKIRPMVMDSASQFKPQPPPNYSLDKKSEFYRELIEVYQISEAIRADGNDSKELGIAKFWDCNPYVSITKGHFMFAEKKITPGAHWMGICKIASLKADADFELTVLAYTKTSIALFDAFISCWDEKYRSNLIRPETLITQHIDPTWQPILQTPPFPEYSSGHSVISNAASKVLTSIFGENFEFIDDTEVAFNLPKRTFTSFYDAAQEAALSRLYGGIHYRSAVEEGATQGENVGNYINIKLQLVKEPTKSEGMLTSNQ